MIAFAGHYVVTHYKIMAVRRWATREQAIADIYFPKTTGVSSECANYKT